MSDLEHLRLAAEVAGIAVDPALPASRHAVIGGLRLHYLDWGASGDDVLFLHGGALTAHTWDLVCLQLRGSHRCIALDQRGHGDSEWSPETDYSMDAYVADVEGFADALALDRFVLVGQSLGAMNAIAYAARHPDRLAGLVVVDAGPEVQWQGARKVADFVMTPAELDSVEEFVDRARSFNPLRDPRLLRRSLLHNLRRLPNGKWTWKYDRRHLSSDWFRDLRARFEALRAELGHISCPVLVIRGAESAVFADEDAERLAGMLARGRWARVDGAGHTVQGDNPRGLVEVLRPFLEEIA